jgi:hypothetical protein
MSDAKVVEAAKTLARMLDMLRKLTMETASSRPEDAIL